MAITRVNGVIKNHKKPENSRKKMRRKENKRENRHNQNKLTLGSKYLTNRLRQVWDYESRQNRRWLIARREAGLISHVAAVIVHKWIDMKTPEERGRLLIEPRIKTGHDAEKQAFKDAWNALTALKHERQEAMRQGGDGVTVDDWWHQGASKRNEMNEQDEVEGREYGEEEDEGFEGEAAMSAASEGSEGSDEDDEDEPPEPVSPGEYVG